MNEYDADGKKHGKWTAWHANGKKNTEVEWRNGKLHGKTTHWHDNGQKSMEGEYRDSEYHGVRVTWDSEGRLLNEVLWDNGVAIDKIEYYKKELKYVKWIDVPINYIKMDFTIKKADENERN